jgi:hypothetical protein
MAKQSSTQEDTLYLCLCVCVCVCVCVSLSLSLSLSLGSLLLLQRRTDSYCVLRTREEENCWKTWRWVLSKDFFFQISFWRSRGGEEDLRWKRDNREYLAHKQSNPKRRAFRTQDKKERRELELSGEREREREKRRWGPVYNRGHQPNLT